jgi:hypothetical protein
MLKEPRRLMFVILLISMPTHWKGKMHYLKKKLWGKRWDYN